MEARYRRELNAGYLILDAPEEPDPYAVRILTENRISGVLPMTLRQIDGRTEYYYEVSGYRPLKKVLEKRQIGSGEIRSLLRGIGRSVDSMEEYLLPVEEVILEPEFLYVTQDLSGVSLCCCPGHREDFFEGLRGLTRYFLNKVDHMEESSVETAYELFRVSSQDNFTFDELLQVPGRIPEASEETPMPSEPAMPADLEEEEEELPVIPAPRKRRGIFRLLPFLRRRGRDPETPPPDPAPEDAGGSFPEAGETQILGGERTTPPRSHCLISQNSLKYETIPLTRLPFVIGKVEGTCDGLIASPVISRIHARIEQREEGICLTDCSSTNGTFLNGMRLAPGEPAPLHNGDEVAFADIRFIFQ